MCRMLYLQLHYNCFGSQIEKNTKVFCSISNYITCVLGVKLTGSKNTCIGNFDDHTLRMVRVDVHIVQDARGDNYITARRVPVSSTAVGKSVNGWILNGGAFISFAGQFNPPSWSATCGEIACFLVILGSLLQKGHKLETWILINFSDRLLPCIWVFLQRQETAFQGVWCFFFLSFSPFSTWRPPASPESAPFEGGCMCINVSIVHTLIRLQKFRKDALHK